jgi:hypothetical protein
MSACRVLVGARRRDVRSGAPYRKADGRDGSHVRIPERSQRTRGPAPSSPRPTIPLAARRDSCPALSGPSGKSSTPAARGPSGSSVLPPRWASRILARGDVPAQARRGELEQLDEPCHGRRRNGRPIHSPCVWTRFALTDRITRLAARQPIAGATALRDRCRVQQRSWTGPHFAIFVAH